MLKFYRFYFIIIFFIFIYNLYKNIVAEEYDSAEPSDDGVRNRITLFALKSIEK